MCTEGGKTTAIRLDSIDVVKSTAVEMVLHLRSGATTTLSFKDSEQEREFWGHLLENPEKPPAPRGVPWLWRWQTRDRDP